MDDPNVQVPRELLERAKRHSAEHGEDVSEFVARAIAEQLAAEDDAGLRDEIDRKVREGLDQIERGNGVDAREALREIAKEFGIGRQG